MMGKATGWLRSLFSGGRKKTSSDGKDKKGWSFMRSLRDKEGGGQKLVSGDRKKGQADPLCCSVSCNACGTGGAGRAVVVGDEEEQSKRAIAVAAATAAVAEAAVAAAQAAAAVVRLTSMGTSYGGASGWRRDEWAAVRIQSAFRGYLAKRALKALKGLVKIQALVRGHIVRKQAAETLRCMHALVRAQARVREGRSLDQPSSRGFRHHSLGSVPPGKYNVRPSNAKVKNASRVKDMSMVDKKVQKSSSWNWLDYWKEEQYRDGRESLSRTSKTDDEKDEKILEIDAGRPHTQPRWRNTRHSVCSTMASDPNSHSFTTMPDSPSKDSTVVQRSVPSPSSVDMQPPLGSLMFPLEGVEYFESPQFYSASSRSRRGPFTPSKRECTRSFFAGYSGYPNYMSNTKSSRAKVRSQSAPRQRPEYEKANNFLGQVQGRGASSGSSSQRSMQLKFAGKAYPGSGRLDRLGMPSRI